MRQVVVAALAMLSLFHPLQSLSAAHLPIEAYGKLPEMSRTAISPNGRYVSWLHNVDGTLVLLAYDLEKEERHIIANANNIDAKFSWYAWANDDTLLVSVSSPQGGKVVEYTKTDLFKYRINHSEKLEPVVKQRKGDHYSQFSDNVISLLPNEPNHILLAIDLHLPNSPSVIKFDLTGTSRKVIMRNKSYVKDWWADPHGNVRMGLAIDDEQIYYRLYDQEEDSWRTLWEYTVLEEPSISVLGFDLDPNILYIRAVHEGYFALFKVDISTDKLDRELVYAEHGRDFDGALLRHPKTGAVIGFTQSSLSDKRVYWNKEYSDFQQAINAALPDSDNIVIDMDRDQNKYIVFSSNGTDPGSYYFGDRSKNQLGFFGETYPMINESNYSGKNNISYKARDGLEINGYVTLPKTEKPENGYPAVILPHGGPHARDYANFDYWSELFANRGYVVLQPNFRGSTGYGFEFQQMALQKWGQGMQDDLQDGAEWLVEQGYADSSRMCIAGGSYGGYAALAAAHKQKETFKCAVSFAGVSDLELILMNARKFTNTKVVRKQFGSDSDALEEASPINFAESFGIPVLLIHGNDDRVVPVRHSREMFEELEDENKDVTYIELEKGDHHLSVEAHRLKALTEMINFVDKHIGNKAD